MDNLALELYGNLIITFLGIFSPLLIILMNISKEGVEALEKIHKSTIEVMKLDIKESVGNLGNDTKEMRSYIKRVEKVVNKHKHSLRLLRPRRQFIRTFCFLMISFILLECYILIDSGKWSYDTSILPKYWYLIVSVIIFSGAMVIIWQILTALIKVREVLKDRNYDDINLSPQPTKKNV